MVKKNYTALRILALIFRILGWLAPVSGIVVGLLIFLGITVPGTAKLTGIISILLGLLYCLIFHSMADFTRAFLSIERNSRKIAISLDEKKIGS